MIVGAFAWPFASPLRLSILAALAAGLASVRWMPWAYGGRALRGNGLLLGAAAFLAAAGVSWLFGIVRRTTHPDDLRPETWANEIDIDDAWEDLLQFLGAFLVAYLPALACLGYAAAHDGLPFARPAFLAALGATTFAGCLYFPMSLLLLGFAGDWRAAFNVPLGVRSMERLGAGYAGVAALFLAAVAVPLLLEGTWVRAAPPFTGGGWLARSAASFAALYLGAAAMRALGLLYLERGGRLGWTSKDET